MPDSERLLAHEIEEGQIVCPFYLAFDVSRSMWDPALALTDSMRRENVATPFEKLNKVVGALALKLANHSEINKIGWLSVLAFADETSRLVPLSPIHSVTGCPPLPKGISTNYVNIFDTLATDVAKDVAALQSAGANLRPPVVYFLTDGAPQANGEPIPRQQWLAAHERLLRAHEHIAIISIGFGKANPSVIRDIGTTVSRIAGQPRMAFIAESTQSPVDLLDRIGKAIVSSLTMSVTTGQLAFHPPKGLRAILD